MHRRHCHCHAAGRADTSESTLTSSSKPTCSAARTSSRVPSTRYQEGRGPSPPTASSRPINYVLESDGRQSLHPGQPLSARTSASPSSLWQRHRFTVGRASRSCTALHAAGESLPITDLRAAASLITLPALQMVLDTFGLMQGGEFRWGPTSPRTSSPSLGRRPSHPAPRCTTSVCVRRRRVHEEMISRAGGPS